MKKTATLQILPISWKQNFIQVGLSPESLEILSGKMGGLKDYFFGGKLKADKSHVKTANTTRWTVSLVESYFQVVWEKEDYLIILLAKTNHAIFHFFQFFLQHGVMSHFDLRHNGKKIWCKVGAKLVQSWCQVGAELVPSFLSFYFTFTRKRAQNLAPTWHQLCTNFAPTRHQLGTNLAPTLHQLCTNFAPTLHQLCTNFAPTLHQLCTNFASTLHQLCTNFASSFHSDHLQLLQDYLPVCFKFTFFTSILLMEKSCINQGVLKCSLTAIKQPLSTPWVMQDFFINCITPNSSRQLFSTTPAHPPLCRTSSKKKGRPVHS